MAKKKTNTGADVVTDDLVGAAVVEEELSPAEIEAQSKKVTEEYYAKQAEQTPKNDERLFSKKEVQEMLKELLAQKEADGDDDEEKPRVHLVTIPRYNNKFVLGFKNMNADEFDKDAVTYAFDVWDEQRRQMVPWVTLLLDDGTDIAMPLETALKKTNKVTCELVTILEEDNSYDFGKTEKVEVKADSYNKEGTGVFVKTKVTQKKYQYDVKPIGTDTVLHVQPEVLNWATPVDPNKK